MYIVDLAGRNNSYSVCVNRDSGQYRCTSIEQDIETINTLLNYWTNPNMTIMYNSLRKQLPT